MEFSISSTNENIAFWLQKAYLSKDTKALIAKAEVLIVPEENFREYPLPVFQRGTLQILDFLKAGLNVEAAIDDENFREVVLNNKIHRIGKYVVNIAVFPLFVGMLTNYIYDKLKYEDAKDEIELEIIVDNNGKNSTIRFKGTAADLKKAKQDIIDLKDGDHGGHREDSTESFTPDITGK